MKACQGPLDQPCRFDKHEDSMDMATGHVMLVYCILETPDKKAVQMHHTKLGYKCDWMTEIKMTAALNH